MSLDEQRRASAHGSTAHANLIAVDAARTVYAHACAFVVCVACRVRETESACQYIPGAIASTVAAMLAVPLGLFTDATSVGVI